MLHIEGLTSGYSGAPAINDIHVNLEEGETVALIGPNGAGKTTLLKTVAGLIRPSSGRVLLRGEDITGFQAHSIAQKGVIMVPEGRRIFPQMSVIENMLMGAYMVRDSAVKEERFQSVYNLFPILKDRREQLGGTLSGGEQQMLAIARAMMAGPKMLFLDEPSFGLAPRVVDQLYDAISKLSSSGVTMLIVEQNISKILGVTSRAYVMQNGRIVMHDSSSALKANQKLFSVYLRSF